MWSVRGKGERRRRGWFSMPSVTQLWGGSCCLGTWKLENFKLSCQGRHCSAIDSDHRASVHANCLFKLFCLQWLGRVPLPHAAICLKATQPTFAQCYIRRIWALLNDTATKASLSASGAQISFLGSNSVFYSRKVFWPFGCCDLVTKQQKLRLWWSAKCTFGSTSCCSCYKWLLRKGLI